MPLTRTFESANDATRAFARKMFRDEADKDEQGILVHLITFDIPDGVPADVYPGLQLNLADTNYDVTYTARAGDTSITYSAFPMQFSGGITMSSDGSIDAATLAVANPDRFFMGYMTGYRGLRGTTVTVKTVYQKYLDYIYVRDGEVLDPPVPNSDKKPDAYIEDYFLIDSYSANETTLTFQLLPAIDFNVRLPRGRYSASTCRFRYKDPNTCGYSGDLPSCKKDLADCQLHSTQVGSVGFCSLWTVNRGGEIKKFIRTGWIVTSLQAGDRIRIGDAFYTYVSAQTQEEYASTFVQVEEDLPNGLAGTGYIYRGNIARFGGFPGVPLTIRRLYF